MTLISKRLLFILAFGFKMFLNVCYIVLDICFWTGSVYYMVCVTAYANENVNVYIVYMYVQI